MGKKAQVISRELLYIIAAPTAANGLGWIRNLVVSCFVRLCKGLAMFCEVRRHEKHRRSVAYDDNLPTERMEATRKWLIED